MTTYEMILEKGIEQGIEQGIEKGIEKGIEQGIEQTLINTTREMISNGCTDQFIMTILHVDLEFIDRVKNERLDEQNQQKEDLESFNNADDFSDN